MNDYMIDYKSSTAYERQHAHVRRDMVSLQFAHGGALGGRRAGIAPIHPRIHVRELGKLQILASHVPGGSDPWERGNVGDGVAVVDDKLAALQVRLQHAQQALRLVAVAVRRIRILALILGEAGEVAVLPEHGADAAHLPHEPLDGLPLVARVLGQEFARFLRQVNQDGTTLEDGDGLAVRALGVHDHWNLGVGVELDELRRVSLTLADVDGVWLVREPHFFQRHSDLYPAPSRSTHPVRLTSKMLLLITCTVSPAGDLQTFRGKQLSRRVRVREVPSGH